MGRRQERVYHVEPEEFPQHFPERLDRFRQAAGLSWRELARRLKVNARIVRRWKAGTKPGPGHLVNLLELAAGMGCSTTCCAEWKSRARSRGRANDRIQAGTHGEGMPGLRSGLLPAVPSQFGPGGVVRRQVLHADLPAKPGRGRQRATGGRGEGRAG